MYIHLGKLWVDAYTHFQWHDLGKYLDRRFLPLMLKSTGHLWLLQINNLF